MLLLLLFVCMKKNYIAHLQEYDARTSQNVKQDKYRKKYIKTVYEKDRDKENIHPNLPSKSHAAKK